MPPVVSIYDTPKILLVPSVCFPHAHVISGEAVDGILQKHEPHRIAYIIHKTVASWLVLVDYIFYARRDDPHCKAASFVTKKKKDNSFGHRSPSSRAGR
jgi:hypothetical protein